MRREQIIKLGVKCKERVSGVRVRLLEGKMKEGVGSQEVRVDGGMGVEKRGMEGEGVVWGAG